MKYIKFGSGKKTFVILPGLSLKSITESAGAVCKAFSDFHDDYTVYVFDRREDIPEGYTVKDMAYDTVAVIRSLEMTDIYLFGASQGGMIALCIAAYFPELVVRAVIGSSTAYVGMEAEKKIREWIEQSEKLDRVKLNKTMMDCIYSEEFLRSYEKILPVLYDRGTEEELLRLSLNTKASLGFDIRDDLKKIKCPVLAIGSEKDKIFGADPSREIAEKTGGEVFIYEGYSHAVYDEAPDYREKIKNFFKK